MMMQTTEWREDKTKPWESQNVRAVGCLEEEKGRRFGQSAV